MRAATRYPINKSTELDAVEAAQFRSQEPYFHTDYMFPERECQGTRMPKRTCMARPALESAPQDMAATEQNTYYERQISGEVRKWESDSHSFWRLCACSP